MPRRLRRLAFPLLSLLSIVALAGCAAFASGVSTSTTPSVTLSTSTPGNLTGVSWTLTGMRVDGVERPVAAPGGRAVTLQFRPDLGQIVGNAGCNGYGAPYTLDGDTLHLEGLGQTLIGCGESVNAVEEAYLAALRRVERLAVSDGGATLILTSADGSVRLIYRRS